jgi:hypothetical protein
MKRKSCSCAQATRAAHRWPKPSSMRGWGTSGKPSQPARAHPAKATGSDEEVRVVFRAVRDDVAQSGTSFHPHSATKFLPDCPLSHS